MALLDGLKTQGTKFVDAAKGLGTNAKAGFTTLGTHIKEVTTGVRTSGAISFIGRTAIKPVEWGAAVVRWPVSLYSGAFKAFPKMTAAGTALGGAMVVGKFLHNRAERQTKAELLAATASGPTGSPYTISPQEQAILNERMSEGRPMGGFAAAETARRQGSAVGGPSV